MRSDNRVVWRWEAGSVLAATVCVWLATAAVHAQTGPLLRLDHLTRLASQATETVDVTLDASMLQMAGSFFSGQDGNSAAFKELVSGLKGVYVKVFEFDRDNVYTSADLDAIRSQLSGGSWKRFVSVQDKTESVEIHAWQEGNVPGGLAILVAEPRELVIVNIVGPIDLSKLASLAGQLGIPAGLPGMPPPAR